MLIVTHESYESVLIGTGQQKCLESSSVWLGGVVVRALNLRLEIAGSISAAALSSATLDKLFTHIVQRL